MTRIPVVLAEFDVAIYNGFCDFYLGRCKLGFILCSQIKCFFHYLRIDYIRIYIMRYSYHILVMKSSGFEEKGSSKFHRVKMFIPIITIAIF